MINRINGKRLCDCTVEELNEAYVGKKYGRLTITNIERVRDKIPTRAMADYICECGTVGRTYLTSIINGKAKSCGCISKELIIEAGKKSIRKRKEVCILNKKANHYFINNDGTVSVVANNDPNTVFIVDFHTWIWFSHIAWGVRTDGYMYTRINGTSFDYHALLYPVPPYGRYVRDHKNRCTFDNRYSNLRVITHRDNMCNTGKKGGYTTNIKGVYIDEYGKYVAMINSSKHGIRLTKRFNTLEEAAMQRREWEEMYQTIEELIVPPLILPNGQLNVYNFPFSWYPDKYSVIWALLGLRVAPYPIERANYINIANQLYRGDYSN